MDYSTFNQYFMNIEPIKAREVLVTLKAADFPKQDKNNREKIHNTFYKMANPKELRTTQPISTNDLVRRMKRMGV